MEIHSLRASWLIIRVLIFISLADPSWGWFFSSTKDSHQSGEHNPKLKSHLVGEFSMEPFNSKKGIDLVENAKNKMLAEGCMQQAYQGVFSSCSKILADHELKSRFAWHLSDCFEKSSGRPSFPHCDPNYSMTKCIQRLDDHAHATYRTFYLEVNNLCHQLQNEAFRYRTESLVNELKSSAEYAEDKLVNIEEKGEQLLQNSKYIHDSLGLIDVRTQQVAETSKNVEGHVNAVLKHSEAIYEQSKVIAASQGELSEGQQKMKEKLQEGLIMVQDSYDNLGVEINNLRSETGEIEKEISKVGDAMFSRMSTLQSKANDIGNMAETSLDKQKELLDTQSQALHGLDSLTKFQSQALEESRSTLQQLAEFGRQQQEELLQRQEQLQRAHDHLVENSKTILAAQEAFESKQANMFLAIDKLFALHNALLLESRMIKAFLYYSLAVLVVYMFTSTKQTYDVRPRLYIGLCVTFLIESAVLRYSTYEIEQPLRTISWIRSLFLLLSAVQLLYSVLKYRDYEMLNHQMLVTLIDKVNNMEMSKKFSWNDESEDEDSEMNWSTWVDADVSEDVDQLADPDYKLPGDSVGGVNWHHTSTLGNRYNLRNRR